MNKTISPLAEEVVGEALPIGRPVGHGRASPPWLWVALLVGAAVTLWWAWFVSGFLSEPSAVGRVLLVLLGSIGLSALSGLAGAVGAVGLIRRESWARALAWIAAVALTLSGAGAIGGVPALVGLVASRGTARP
ncbi:MAG TPA: hypothetical protein VIP57_09135 [Candidatus Dormibacteraeota bacterium]